MKQKVKKTQSKEDIEAQIFTLGKLLENQPKIIDGKWNSRWFSLEGRIKQLRKELTKPVKTDFNKSWQEFLSK